MTNFRKTHALRRRMADEVQKKIGLTDKLNLHGGVKGSFYSSLSDNGYADQALADVPMWRVPYLVIAKKMSEALPNHHVIDHAWWLIAVDKTTKVEFEPWGFVTEPYLSAADAEIIRQLHFPDWGVDIEVLPTESSAWNPGSTIPIITTCRSGCLSSFLKFGVGAALELL